MDFRKPKEAVPRIRELLKQYERVVDDMNKTTISSDISGLEREGILVIQEIGMTAPLLHDALMQYSKEARAGLSERVKALTESDGKQKNNKTSKGKK